jgi:hypothetical protein
MRTFRFISGFILLTAALSAQQFPANPDDQGAAGPPDQPGNPVARISVLNGDASVRHGDAGDWIAVALNAPLMTGDTLSVTPGATVELQFDAAHFARVAGDSEVRIAAIDNTRYQLQLSKGLVTYRILRQSSVQGEVDTPLVAVRQATTSSVRVEVAPDNSTRVTVRHGSAEVYTPKGTEHVSEANTMTVRGSQDDPEFQVAYAIAPDAWDTWNDQRDTYLLRAQSPRYVSQDVYGTEDLDNYGRWGNDPQYGDVWTPNVPATWAPYRNGQWVWNDYYGWTWVDYDPWGWAPFHYGSWYFRTGFGWSWFPGPRYGHYWYHPALVGFFGFGGGGFGIGFGFGNVGWIPLAPFERFRPWYGGGRAFAFNNVNIVRNVSITNVYRNARFANGVTAVSATDFQRGNFRNPVAVDRTSLAQASLVHGGVPMTPTAANRSFTNRPAAAAGPRSSTGGQRFFTPQGGATAARGNTGGAPGWQRFGSSPAGGQARAFQQGAQQAPQQRFQSAPQGAFGAGGSRSLQVTPPIVRQRQAAPSYSAPSYNRGGGYSAPAPSYRSAPAPSYRSAPAPAPAPRSAPSAPSRSGGGGGGGGHPSGGGGHGGGRR